MLPRTFVVALAVATVARAAGHRNPHAPAATRPTRNSSAACPITPDTVVAVYAAVGEGGVGEFSHAWTNRFFTWWAAANPALVWLEVSDPASVSVDCVLTDFPGLRLWVQPGGDALNQSLALGPGGRDNLLNYIYYGFPHAHYMGTCAGMFYAAGTYWWYDEFEVNAFQAHWYPTVEGPITAVAAYPAYAPTDIVVDEGGGGAPQTHRMVYWGGPASGLNYTTAKVPGTVLARFADVADGAVPAVVAYGSLLLNSPHLEAVEGVGLACDAPLPPGCITAADRLRNWQLLARRINAHIGTDFVVPAELGRQL